MNQLYRAIAPVAFCLVVLDSGVAASQKFANPFSFFEGETESVGTLKVIMRKPAGSRTVGHGNIEPNGSLSLVQRVEDEGRPPYVRRWLIRQVAPGHFVGTMSEATGPVTIDEVGDRYRFRFKMSGSVSVEQWLTPLPGGQAARSDMTVRKFGIAVARFQGVVRKIS